MFLFGSLLLSSDSEFDTKYDFLLVFTYPLLLASKTYCIVTTYRVLKAHTYLLTPLGSLGPDPVGLHLHNWRAISIQSFYITKYTYQSVTVRRPQEQRTDVKHAKPYRVRLQSSGIKMKSACRKSSSLRYICKKFGCNMRILFKNWSGLPKTNS